MQDDANKLNELVSAIDTAMKEYEFSLNRQGDNILILYRQPGRKDHEFVKKRLLRIITAHTMSAKFEWSENNWEKLSINLLEYTPSEPQVVRGEIGRNIGGRTIVFVPDSDNKEIYVTLSDERTENAFIECDIEDIPSDVKIYAHCRVLVNKTERIIVGIDNTP